MNKMKLWIIVALIVCGMVMAACSSDDDSVVEPTTELLQDGVWTGSGEGRGGTIVVKMTVENHEITDIVVVSQSESSFAQEALNEMVARALEKPREFDPRGQATLTPASKNTLTPYGKIKMTLENDCFSGAFL